MGFSFSKLAKRAVSTLTGKDLFDSVTGKNAAERSSAAQQAAAQGGIEEQRTQFEQAQKTLSPYVQAGIPALSGFKQYQDAGSQALGGLNRMAQAGQPALEQQQAYLGLGGSEAQQQFMQGIEQSPQYQQMVEQGENAMLQNASATGGLRGGNMQGALAEYRPQVLNQLANQKYAQLGGIAGMGGNVGQFLAGQGQSATGNLASLGQSSAAGQASQGMQTGANIANLMGQQGAAVAAGQNAIQAGRMGLLNMGIQGGKMAMGMF